MQLQSELGKTRPEFLQTRLRFGPVFGTHLLTLGGIHGLGTASDGSGTL